MNRRDDDGTRHRPTRRPAGDAGDVDAPAAAGAEPEPVDSAPKASTKRRPLPPVPARFDRSQRLPAQSPPASQPSQPRRGANGVPSSGPVDSGRHSAADAAGPPTGSGWHAAQVSAEDAHDLRVRKIDESLTRMTAAHAGLPRGVGATTRDDGGANSADDAADARGNAPTIRRRLIRTGKGVAIVTAAILFVVAAIGWGAKKWLNTQIREVAALDLTSDAIVNPGAQAGDENFLLVGSDNRPGAQRSDSIMVVHLPADRSRAVVVSFPRSIEVDRPACRRWDAAAGTYRAEQVAAEPHSTLSTTHETGGPSCLTKVIQRVSGLSITRFVGMDFVGFRDMVDAANGVEICVEKPVIDGVLGVVVPDAGTSKIDGARALDFVRARNVRGDPTADYGQIQRQQSILFALLRAAASNSVAMNPTAARGFVSAFADHGIADRVGVDELILLAQSMQALNPGSAIFRTTPTTGQANTRGNEVLRDADTAALFTALRDNTKLPDPAAASGGAQSGSSPGPATDPGLQPKDVRVQVLNASDRAGLAGQVGSSLQKLNFTVVAVEDAASPADRTVIRYSPDRGAQAKVLAAVVPDAAMQRDDAGTATLQLLLGANFDGIVSPLAANSGPTSSSRAAPPVPAAPTASCR